MRRPLVAALLAVTLLTSLPAVGEGETDDPLDYDIPNGHFYTQTNGAAPGSSARGYSITNDFGVPFWSEFQRLGAVERLGYPITQRFIWHGFITQATQKAVLQWDPDLGRVQLVNVLDYLADIGKEEWLQQKWFVPRRSPAGSIAVADPDGVLAWLANQEGDTQPFRRHYGTALDPMRLHGLPTSPPRNLGDLTALRFQRTVLQLWKVSGPGVTAGVVTSLNAGDVLKASGAWPAETLEPQEGLLAEVRAEARRQSSSRDARAALRCVATWYGADFQGRHMRNGERYDLNDATTTAANIFPLGTWLRVTNLDNGASVEVRVTDTGAFRYPIVVDLSWAAFKKLAHPDRGVIEVLVQPLHRE